MKLKNLLSEFNIFADDNSEVKGIALDSRKVLPGYIFVAMKGFHVDGYNFIDTAIKNGAICVVAERDFNVPQDKKVEKIITNDVYGFSTKLALVLFDNPSKKLNLVGITGTNGKTTTSYILESIYKAAGQKTGVIGTIQNKICDEIFPTENTTPFPVELQELLHKMVEKGVKSVFMEVSSHALDLGRTNGCKFDAAIFTNLTKEHLDFHITMKNYLLAKKKLINAIDAEGYVAINSDDKHAEKIIENTKAKIIKFSIKQKKDVFVKNIKFNKKNLTTELEIVFSKKESLIIQTNLVGKHNVSNILAAASIAYSQEISLDSIKNGIENLYSVAGRFELVKAGQNFACVVDFAHTDDAMMRILKTAKSMKMNRIITLFGCGGNRDRKKRPLMAKAAAKYSDFVFVTSDNPREEDPKKIVLDIEVGFNETAFSNYKTIIDREQAIAQAVNFAREGDLLLILGKGHENYQIIGTQKIHFSDQEIATKKIREMLEKNKKQSTLF